MPMRRDRDFDSARPTIGARHYQTLLRGVFRHAVGCALASSLAATGCRVGGGEIAREQGATADPVSAGSERSGPAQGDRQQAATGVTTPACEAGTARLLVGLAPSERFDAAELRQSQPVRGASPGADVAPQVLGSEGVLCGTASDRERCKGEIARVEGTLAFDETCGMLGSCATYVVTTERDLVRKYESQAELLKLLGAIDSPADAFLLLSRSQFIVQCADPARELPSGGPEASSIRVVADGFEASVLVLLSDCPYQFARATVHVARDGRITERSREQLPSTGVCAGRRPEGLLSQHRARSASRLGEHFARMAHLEAASVDAFQVIAAELAHHGAPRALVVAAERAAADEVRHAELTSALAVRYGARPSAPLVAARPLRTLEAIALDNVREGCVRECFGAAVGCYQAQAATDPEIARAMAVIAEDETRHAALAFELAGWLDPRLDAGARARVASARAGAVSALRAELASAPDEPEHAALGLPDAAAALRLHDALHRSLWSAHA